MILDFLKISANLKKIQRKGWIEKLAIKNPESVADHTFSMSVMGMVFSDLKKYNTEKVLKMIILHDLAESITGDFTPEEKSKEEKRVLENATIKSILSNLPLEIQNQYLEIWYEFQKKDTPESKFVHQIDKLEMALQAKIYSSEINSTDKIIPFLKSAQTEINDQNLLKLFEQISFK